MGPDKFNSSLKQAKKQGKMWKRNNRVVPSKNPTFRSGSLKAGKRERQRVGGGGFVAPKTNLVTPPAGTQRHEGSDQEGVPLLDSYSIHLLSRW